MVGEKTTSMYNNNKKKYVITSGGTTSNTLEKTLKIMYENNFKFSTLIYAQRPCAVLN